MPDLFDTAEPIPSGAAMRVAPIEEITVPASIGKSPNRLSVGFQLRSVKKRAMPTFCSTGHDSRMRNTTINPRIADVVMPAMLSSAPSDVSVFERDKELFLHKGMSCR